MDLDKVDQLQRTMMNEVYRVMGISSRDWLKRFISFLSWAPAHRFSRLLADFDADVATCGYRIAAAQLINRFIKEVQIIGKENIPLDGPLLVASNHPGTYDAFAIMSEIPRDDMKIVVEDLPVFKCLTSISAHIIFAPKETVGRMQVVRSMIHQLNAGGGVLIFPSGKLDPDPQVFPGAETALDAWSPSLDVILRKVPQTQVIVTIVSGMLSQSSVNNLVTKRFDEFVMKIRVAEFFQLFQQSILSRKLRSKPLITFAEPFRVLDFPGSFETAQLMQDLKNVAKGLLKYHAVYDLTASYHTDVARSG